MDFKKDFVYPILVAIGYFTTVFFATTGLVPVRIALVVAAIIALLAVLWLRWLQAIGMDEWGAPMGVLIVLPFICIVAGAVWWVLHWLSLLGY